MCLLGIMGEMLWEVSEGMERNEKETVSGSLKEKDGYEEKTPSFSVTTDCS